MAYQFPKEIQEKITNFEQIKMQLQGVMAQRGEIEARKKEIDSSVKALEERKDGDIYKRVGDLLIKVEDAGALLGELKEEAETMDVRLNSLQSQETNLKEMYEKLGKEINESLKG